MSSENNRISPQQQLWKITNEKQHSVLKVAFRRLKHRDQQDLCYAIIAKIRFGVNRQFEDPVMQYFYGSIEDALKSTENESMNSKNNLVSNETD